MPRKNPEQRTVIDPMDKLDELVPQYALNKGEFDSYKAIVDSEKEQIKDLLFMVGEKKHTAGGYTVTRSVSTKESWDEDKLLAVAKKYNLPCVKTKEYVDMQALEDYLYSNTAPADCMLDLDKCRTQKETVALRLSKAKKKEDE